MKAGKHFTGGATKLAILTAHMRAGEWREALSFAAKFPTLQEKFADGWKDLNLT